MTVTIDCIKRLYDTGDLDSALDMARTLVRQTPADADAWFLLGKILWRLDRRAEATSAYRTAVDIDPDNPAAIALTCAEDIAGYFNPDLFNP